MRRACLLLSLFVLSHAGAEEDAYITGEKLLETCKAPPASFTESMCFFYLSSVTENWHGRSRLGDADAAPNFCVPANVTGSELRDAAVTYLEAHPGMLRLPASEQVISAFRLAFPCD